METFGELVVRLRGERHLTQARLADRAECDTDTIARVEQGRGSWFRRTAQAVYIALSEAKPLTIDDARAYFRLSSFQPAESIIERDMADGRIVPRHVNPPQMRLPQDIEDDVSRMLFTFGEARVRALLRTVNALAISQEPGPVTSERAPRVPGAVVLETSDPETGTAVTKYLPVDPPSTKPSASRKRKSG